MSDVSRWGDQYADAECSIPAYRSSLATYDGLYLLDADFDYPAPSLHWASELRRGTPTSTVYDKLPDGSCRLHDEPISRVVMGDTVPWDDYPRLEERNRPPTL